MQHVSCVLRLGCCQPAGPGCNRKPEHSMTSVRQVRAKSQPGPSRGATDRAPQQTHDNQPRPSRTAWNTHRRREPEFLSSLGRSKVSRAQTTFVRMVVQLPVVACSIKQQTAGDFPALFSNFSTPTITLWMLFQADVCRVI